MNRFVFCIALMMIGSTAAAAPAEKPNLLFVLVDQWRGQAMGFVGVEPVITPNLDKFSAQALVLPQAVSNFPVCSPYRGMLMTGKYPHANKVISNCNSRTAPHNVKLQKNARCWSDVLAGHDYSLGYIGKWHLEAPYKPYVKSYNNSEKFAWNEWTPPDRRHGFDFWYAYNTFDRHLSPEYWSTDMTRDQRAKIKQWGPEHEADLAINFIKNSEGKYRKANHPFALVVSMNPPHTPYGAVPKRYVERYRHLTDEQLVARRPNVMPIKTRWGDYYRKNVRNYYAQITGVDEQFGRILAALKQTGADKNTLVIFTADHGNCLGAHGMVTKNNHFEESMRIPLMVRMPGRIKPRHDNLLISVPDMYPTMLDLMGFGADVPADLHGVSHARLFVTGQGPRPTSQMYIYIPYDAPGHGRRGVRTERYTIVLSRLTEKSKVTDASAGYPNGFDKVVLYDNQADPYQLKDLAKSHPQLVKQLIDEHLNPWLKRTGDPWPRAK